MRSVDGRIVRPRVLQKDSPSTACDSSTVSASTPEEFDSEEHNDFVNFGQPPGLIQVPSVPLPPPPPRILSTTTTTTESYPLEWRPLGSKPKSLLQGSFSGSNDGCTGSGYSNRQCTRWWRATRWSSEGLALQFPEMRPQSSKISAKGFAPTALGAIPWGHVGSHQASSSHCKVVASFACHSLLLLLCHFPSAALCPYWRCRIRHMPLASCSYCLNLLLSGWSSLAPHSASTRSSACCRLDQEWCQGLTFDARDRESPRHCQWFDNTESQHWSRVSITNATRVRGWTFCFVLMRRFNLCCVSSNHLDAWSRVEGGIFGGVSIITSLTSGGRINCFMIYTRWWVLRCSSHVAYRHPPSS